MVPAQKTILAATQRSRSADIALFVCGALVLLIVVLWVGYYIAHVCRRLVSKLRASDEMGEEASVLKKKRFALAFRGLSRPALTYQPLAGFKGRVKGRELCRYSMIQESNVMMDYSAPWEIYKSEPSTVEEDVASDASTALTQTLRWHKAAATVVGRHPSVEALQENHVAPTAALVPVPAYDLAKSQGQTFPRPLLVLENPEYKKGSTVCFVESPLPRRVKQLRKVANIPKFVERGVTRSIKYNTASSTARGKENAVPLGNYF